MSLMCVRRHCRCLCFFSRGQKEKATVNICQLHFSLAATAAAAAQIKDSGGWPHRRPDLKEKKEIAYCMPVVCVCKSRSGIIRGCAAVIAPELDTFKGSLHSKEMYMYIKASAIGRGPNDDMAGEGEFSVAQIYAE